MQRLLMALAAFFGASGVALGAFGAHGLRSHLTPEKLSAFQTGVQYQMLHAVALLALSRANGQLAPLAVRGCMCLALGTFLFSGSIYGLTVYNLRALGPVTPIGGIFLVGGWLLVLAAACRALPPA